MAFRDGILVFSEAGALPPSIFIVGDRKQSIYAFRDADVSVLGDAAAYMNTLRPEAAVSRAISRSFRSVGPLLGFVNDVCADLDLSPHRRDAFRFDEQDRFPLAGGTMALTADSLGLVTSESAEGCAALVADEIASMVRDRIPRTPRGNTSWVMSQLSRTRVPLSRGSSS